MIESRQILVWLILLAAMVGYGFLRPGVWVWLILVALIAFAINLAYRKAPRVQITRNLSSDRTFQGSSITDKTSQPPRKKTTTITSS